MVTTPPPSPDNHLHLPRFPQFSLRTLLVVVTLFGGLFALMSEVGALWSVALGWFLLLAAAHVAANAWGRRLHGRRMLPSDDDRDDATSGAATPVVFAPSTRLCRQVVLGRTMPVVTAACAVAGGSLGTYLLCLMHWGRVGIAGIALGGLSAAVIGGFFGFLASSFLEVALQALHEAGRGSSE